MCSQLQNFYTIFTPTDIIKFNRKSPNLNKNHQFWPQKHQIQPLFLMFNQKSPNMQNRKLHRKMTVMNNEEVGINLP